MDNWQKYNENKLGQFLLECKSFGEAIVQIQKSDVFDLSGIIVDLPVISELRDIVLNINTYLDVARSVDEGNNHGAEVLKLLTDEKIKMTPATYECKICKIVEHSKLAIVDHVKSDLHQKLVTFSTKKVPRSQTQTFQPITKFPYVSNKMINPNHPARAIQPPIGSQTPPMQQIHQQQQQFAQISAPMYRPHPGLGPNFIQAPRQHPIMSQGPPPGFQTYQIPLPNYQIANYQMQPPPFNLCQQENRYFHQNTVPVYAFMQPPLNVFNKKPAPPSVLKKVEEAAMYLGSPLVQSPHAKDSNNNNMELDKLPTSNSPTERVSRFLKAVDLDKYLNTAIKIGTKTSASDVVKIIMDDLDEMLKPYFPACKLYAYGSRVYGMADSKSDLDVFVDTGYLYHDTEKQSTKEHFKVTVANIINQISSVLGTSDKFQMLSTLTGARIPLIRCLHENEEVEIDLTFSNGMGVENTKLLEYFFKLQPICLKMSMFMKVWFAESQIFPDISNFMLAILVIYFFQSKALLPSVGKLVDQCEEKKFISYWQVSFEPMTLTDLKMNSEDGKIQTIAKQFFEFYKIFDFGYNIISPYLGYSIPKNSYKDPDSLPIQLNTYQIFAKDQTNVATSLQFEFNSPMVVQSPFALSANMTKGFSQAELIKLVQFFGSSYEFFKQY